MTAAGSITAVRAHLLRPTRRSVWILTEVLTADGLTGLGEASLHFSAEETRREVLAFGRRIEGLSPRAALLRLADAPGKDLVQISARCSLDQALHDIEARRLGISIARLLNRTPAAEVEVYANINRRTDERSPAGFAASARRAVAAGFEAVKIAPFDGLNPELGPKDAAPLVSAGLARMAAVREALGASRRLLVDCHWRLPDHMLETAVSACAELDVFWLETPYPEDSAHLDAIRRARGAANAKGVRLAGCELKTGQAGFAPYLEAGCYDVVMPDMKYVGGYADFMAVARAAARHGVAVAPHNPTGPVCHAHSVQASAAVEDLLILEMQFDETPLFEEIVDGDLPMPAHGKVRTPAGPGLGLELRLERLRALEDA